MNRRRFDIRQYKKNLRAHYKAVRGRMDPEEKAARDGEILRKLLTLPEYRRAKVLLTFVSTPREVDTHRLIEAALRDGKGVAVPYCVEGTRDMDFYLIRSMDQLECRTFGVLEPVPERCEKLERFSNSLCVLPGLAFDKRGYRLGYGGGYYDRFLSHRYGGGATVGICYSACLRQSLVHGRFDMPCRILVTDKSVRRFDRAPWRGEGPSHGKRAESP